MKKKSLLTILVTLMCTFLAFGFAACNKKESGGSSLRINAPKETVLAELGSFDLPKYDVINSDNLIDPRYSTNVVSVTDPDGNKVNVVFNKIQATKTGVYTVVYGSSKGIDNVTVRFDFADRLAPTLNIDVEQIPNLYCSGIEYVLPSYTISGGPVLEECYAKIMYQAVGSTERIEIPVENSRFTPQYDDGTYYVVIHVEDAVGNEKNYEYKVTAFPGIKEEIPDKITYFDEPFGTTQATMYWPGPNKIEYDSEIAYGDENGSLKVVAKGTQDWNYLLLSNPWLKDVSQYDYLEFYVYNPTEHPFMIEPGCSGLPMKCEPKEWSRIILPTSYITDGKCTQMSNAVIKTNNISNMPIRYYGFNMNAGEGFHVSAIYGRTGEVPKALNDNAILRLFEDRITNITMSSNATAEINTDATYNYGDENGSMKVTRKGSGEIYAILTFPETKNVSNYHELVFRVYNPTNNVVKVGLKWVGDTDCAPKAWTEVTIPVSEINAGKLYNGDTGAIVKATHLVNPTFRVISGLANGESLYFSGFYARFMQVPDGYYFEDESISLFSSQTTTKQLSLMTAGAAVDSSVSVTWTSSNTEVATVNNSGLLTVVGKGKTTITAKVGEDEATIDVIIDADAPIADFSIGMAGMKLYKTFISTAYDTSVKYEGENGTLKVTRNTSGEGYMALYSPLTTDLTNYDYLVFRVYNPTSADVKMGICWYGDTVCKAGEWTEIKINLDEAWGAIATNGTSQIDDIWSGLDIPRNNIKGLALRLISGLSNGESVYVSNVYAVCE